jgi:23S rRNA maturation-related 3'-5' exoribonuclease YhaM
MNSITAGRSRDAIINCANNIDAHDETYDVINNENFFIWSGSSKPYQHHYGKHGLITHTAEVIKLCILNNITMDADIDRKELFYAALFHDLGKVNDYAPVDGMDYQEWESSDHKRHIHHISRSAIIWHDFATKNNIPEDAVLHAILAHHGQREWGSPVGPNTKLAWMLHLCDGISARMYDAETWDQVKVK